VPTRYIVVVGSLLSGIGKGIVSSSIVKILSTYDLNVMPLKFDGYLNYDCGTMNPMKHGEVFVLDDTSEVDMDFGTYERFLNKDLTGDFSFTGGKLFSEIISKERKGDFLGSDVQIIPHMTDLILKKIDKISKENNLDVLLIEVGGTVGDIENSYFIEAMRELALKNKVVFVDVTYVPELDVVGEQKTKPTQLAIRALMQSGIQPNFIVTRSTKALSGKTREKIALFSNLPPERIIDNCDTKNIYRVPLNFMDNGFDKQLLVELGFDGRAVNSSKLSKWKDYIANMEDGKKNIEIAIVGKYVNLHDSYVSIQEAIVHASAALGVRTTIKWIESEMLEKNKSEIENQLKGADGILVPYGFGSRGISGMIDTIEYARVNKVPYFGICLGMQLMAVEFARNVAQIKNADSAEFGADSSENVIDIMESQKSVTEKGGTMRLGSWPAKISPNTYASSAYKSELIHERHRHRYEFNNKYREQFSGLGLKISATTPDDRLVEIIEWKDSFGLGTQAHPELKSRPERPSPLFMEFIRNAAKIN
jgi:CTP synthase